MNSDILRTLFLYFYVSPYLIEVLAKFEVCSFTHSWDNKVYQKIWAVPAYAHAQFSPNGVLFRLQMDSVNVPAKF